jgi:hypothetical protein
MSRKPTFSRVKPPRRTISLSDGTPIDTDDTKIKQIRTGKTGRHEIQDKTFSTETGKGDNDWEVTDNHDSLPYPPPSTHPFFRKCWAEILPNLMARSNFQEAHLGLLEALCRLRVELRTLDEFIQKNGHTFRITTVLGDQRKTYPEVTERLKVLTQIASYTKMLDLLPKKDKSKGSVTPEAEEEWK